MALWSGAELQLLPENATQRRIVPTQGIAHTAVDAKGLTRLWRYFGRVDVKAETHLWFPFSGPPVQMMDTEVEADANRLADARAVSWETEDDGNPVGNPWNDHQLEQQAQFMVWLHRTHGIPAVQIPFGDDRAPGFGWHAMHGFDDPIAQTGRRDNPWSFYRGKTCPGPTRIRQFVYELLPDVQRRVARIDQEEADMAVWFIEIDPQPGANGRRSGWVCKEGQPIRAINGAPEVAFVLGEIVHANEDHGQVLTTEGDYFMGWWADEQGLGFRPNTGAAASLSDADVARIAAAVETGERGEVTIELTGRLTS
ncbi:MAG: hypothetical protein AAGA99_08965 [Actinomycetota bacterium]